MGDPGSLGRLILMFGALLVALGALLMFGARIPWLGRLPGDLSFGGEHWRVYLPLGTCLVLSLVLALILRVVFRK